MTCLHQTVFLLLLPCLCQLQALVIDRSELELTAVPQDVTVTVTEFILISNRIREIDHTSFAIYTSLEKVDLTRNPLKHIRENSFQNNLHLVYFACSYCKIVSLPANFCPCVASITEMHFNEGIDPSVADTIFRYPYFEAFTSLKKVGLAEIPMGNTAVDVKLPPTIVMLLFSYVGLTRFPNVTASVFPILQHLRIHHNPMRAIPDDMWEQVSDQLKTFHVNGNSLSVMVDLTLKPNLNNIDISWNDLETVPDLLNMPSLTIFHLAENSRMACDRRMCWRRLWDRIRPPLKSSDDVTCRQPPELAGYTLSMVNPKLMDRGEGTHGET